MSIFARTLLLLFTLTSSLQANFSLKNNTSQPIHFVITGANDLLGLRNGNIEAAKILTLLPGQQYQDTISLTGILEKPPKLELFPSPQGQQFTLEVPLSIAGQINSLHLPVGAVCTFELPEGVPSSVELVQNGNEVHLLAVGTFQVITSHEPYERLNQWACNPDNHQAYCDFQAQVYTFVHEFVRAGGVMKFLFFTWPQHSQLAKALSIWNAKRKFEDLTGINLVEPGRLQQYFKYLGL